MAREVQSSLMPRQIPPLPDGSHVTGLRMGMLYCPCKSLGGDCFTVLPVSATEAAVLLCDVVGHGVRSALVTAVLRGLVEEARPVAHDPGQFLSQINRAFMQVLAMPDRVLFVTAVCVFVDTRRGLVLGANAGHPPPIRMDASGRSEWLLFRGAEAAPALGLDRAFAYQTLAYPMGVGDRLLLYTDGIHEACAPGGEEYGRERLMAAFTGAGGASVEEAPDRMLRAARQFAGREEFEDDVCLVSLERTGELPPGGEGAP
jgi:serine phosphatase RsbU (regulator of sigma subunit)